MKEITIPGIDAFDRLTLLLFLQHFLEFSEMALRFFDSDVFWLEGLREDLATLLLVLDCALQIVDFEVRKRDGLIGDADLRVVGAKNSDVSVQSLIEAT